MGAKELRGEIVPAADAGGATRSQAAANRVPCLVLLSERYGDKVFPLHGATTTIGRSIEREVLIDDPQISKRHAEVVRRPDGTFLLRDTASRNGTRVNGEATQERVLKAGDRIELGDAVTLFFTDKQIASDTTRREAAAGRGVAALGLNGGSTGKSGRIAAPGAALAAEGAAPVNGAGGAPGVPTQAPGAAFSKTHALPALVGFPPAPGADPNQSATDEKIRALPSAVSLAGKRLALPHDEVAAAGGDRRPARVMGRLDEGSLTILYQIASALGAARTEKELFERALELTTALIPADRAYVFVPEGGKPRLVAAKARDAAAVTGLDMPASTTIVEQVLHDRTAIATTDAASDERFMGAESVVRNRIRAVMAAPMVVQGRASGVLYLDHEAPGYLFNKAELHLVTAIAFHVGHALETARAMTALEKRVEERTQEVQRLSRERAELLAMAAHDLKTPLAGLVGYLECLGERASAEGAPAWIGEELCVLTDAGQSMMQLLVDLLDSQRAEAGKIAVAREETELPPFLREVAKIYERWALGAGRRVELVARDPLPRANIDRRRVTQILNNLVHNGLKYTPRDGCVRIEVRAPVAGTLEVTVCDEGAGFNPSDSDRILLSFERGTSKEPVARGTGHGLGLSIVKKLVALMGGTLAIDGRPGKGARFTFTLPC